MRVTVGRTIRASAAAEVAAMAMVMFALRDAVKLVVVAVVSRLGITAGN